MASFGMGVDAARNLAVSPGGLWPVLALGGALLACGPPQTEGDRAAYDGACPPGETCSAESGEGLYFEGPGHGGWFDSSIIPIALGGTVKVGLVDPRGYAVTNYQTNLEPGLLRVVAEDVDQVTLHAVAEGSCTLRILDLHGKLRDRTTLTVVKPLSLQAYYGFTLGSPTSEERELMGVIPLESAALFIGAPDAVTIDVGGGLWDDAATVSVAGATLEDAFPAEVGAVEVTVRGGDLESTFVLPIVDAPDPVELSPRWTHLDPLGRSSTACFQGWAGARPVAGLTCTFAPDPGVEVVEEYSMNSNTCVTLTLAPDGSRGVTVTCGRTVRHWAHPISAP